MKKIKNVEEFKNEIELEKIFDIDNIPISKLNKAYVEYEPIQNDIDFYALDEEYVWEEKNQNSDSEEILNAHDVVNQVKSHVDLQDFQIKVNSSNGVKFLDVRKLFKDYPDYITMELAMLIPDISNNIDIISKFLDSCGYFLVKKATYKDHDERVWGVLIFDPKKQESIRERVLNQYKYAYHTTPAYNADSIEEKGILAKSASKTFATNTKRVYMYLGNPSSPKYIKMMKSISTTLKQKDKNFTGDFVEYEIILQKLPDNVEFYIDIHGYSKNFVYIESNIPPTAIRNSEDKIY